MLPTIWFESRPPRFRAAWLAGALGLGAFGFSLLAGYAALGQSDEVPRGGRGQFFSNADRDSSAGQREKSAERKREGTRIVNELGTFQNLGDRLAFLPAGDNESYRVLENLALERVDRALDETRGQRQWVVSGVLTEFRGTNYLLITKAIIRLQEGDTAGP
jgi:hypothetical protein